MLEVTGGAGHEVLESLVMGALGAGDEALGIAAAKGGDNLATELDADTAVLGGGVGKVAEAHERSPEGAGFNRIAQLGVITGRRAGGQVADGSSRRQLVTAVPASLHR